MSRICHQWEEAIMNPYCDHSYAIIIRQAQKTYEEKLINNSKREPKKFYVYENLRAKLKVKVSLSQLGGLT